MEAALCKKVVEYIAETETQLTLTSIDSILSSTYINDKIMEDPLKNKDLAMCILSNLIYYYDKDILNNNINKWGIEYKLIVLDTLVYIVFYSKEYIFIVFKGTTNFKEVISDLDFIQVDDLYNIKGKMHKGFHNLILKDKVVESIKDELEKLIPSSDKIPIIITGHSLGASLATIFYAYLMTIYKDYNVELITFGSPRVGDYEFSKSLISKRIVNGNDIITKIPIIKYNHTENLIKLGSSYSCRVFSDHSLQEYYSELIKKSNILP